MKEICKLGRKDEEKDRGMENLVDMMRKKKEI